MTDPAKPQSKRDPTPSLRSRAEAALKAGDLDTARSLGKALSERKTLGPWDRTVLGRIALASGDAGEAKSWFKQAHDNLPGEGAILVHLAEAQAATKQWAAAASTLAEAIVSRPGIADLHERHGIYLGNAGKETEAMAALERTLALEPNHPGALALVGERHLADDDLAAAKAALLGAIDSDASHRSALSNLALVQEREGDLIASLDTLNRLCSVEGAEASLFHRRGQVLLSLGRLEEGWVDYARRLKSKAYKSWQYALRVPYWSGEDIGGQSLVVWTDQGLGEQILTASLLPDVINRADSVTLACDPRLITLFQRSFSSIEVVSLEATRNAGEGVGSVDIQASISELGAVLWPTLKSFSRYSTVLEA